MADAALSEGDGFLEVATNHISTAKCPLSPTLQWENDSLISMFIRIFLGNRHF